MSTLSSTSTLDEIKAAYMDNASYEEDASVAKAKAFVTACRLLLMKIPKVSQDSEGARVEMNPDLIQREMAEAREYVRAHEPTTTAGSTGRATSRYFKGVY